MIRRFKMKAIAAMAIALAITAQAQTVATWNSASGEISDGSNWTGGVVPNQTGDTGTIASGTALVGSTSGAWAGTLNIDSGGAVQVLDGTDNRTTWADVRLNGGQITTPSDNITRCNWGDVSSQVTLTGADNLFNFDGAEVLQFFPSITGSGGFTKTGDKTLRLVGITLDFSGDVRVEGLIDIWNTAAGSMPNATLDMAGGGLRTYNTADGIVTFGGLKGSGDLLINRTADGIGSIMQEFCVGGNNQSTEFSGDLGSTTAGPDGVTFVKKGTGTLTLSGTNIHDGGTRVDAGTLLISGTHASAITVKNGAVLGGSGTVSNSVVFESGAKFVFSLTDLLTVTGGSVDLGSLSVANLVGLDPADVTAGQTYPLIAGTATFVFDNVQNTTPGTAADIGSGKYAYFSSVGGLQLVVTDELVVPVTATWNAASGDIYTGSNWTGGETPDQPDDTGTISSGVAQIFSGSADWTGTLNINSDGTVEIQNGANNQSTWSDVRMNGGQITTASGATRTYWGNSGSVLTLIGTNNQMNLAGTEALQFYPNITGTGGLTYSGTKVLRLVSSIMDFSGDFRMESGRTEIWSAGGGSMPNATLDIVGGELRTYNTTDGIVTFGGLKGSSLLMLNRTADGTGSILQEFRVGGNNQDTEFSGTLTYTASGPTGVEFVKQGIGSLTLAGTVSYDGATRVEAGSLLINGTQTGGDTITVEDGAALGGSGTTGSSVVFEDGAGVAFNPAATLTIDGSTVDLGNLSVANVVGLDPAGVTVGQTYPLIDGTANFIVDDVRNTTPALAADIGSGKYAWLNTSGGLTLVVTDERVGPVSVVWDVASGEISTGYNWTGGVVPNQSGDTGTVTSGVAQITSDTGAWAGTLNINSGGAIEIQNGAVANSTWSDVRLNGGQITTPSDSTARSYWGNSGSVLTLIGSNNQMNLGGADVLQFYPNITGSGGLTYAGTKVLRLVSSTMDFEGDFRIESGRIEVWNTSGGSMPNTTLDVVGGEVRTFNTTDGIVTFGGLKGSGLLNLNRTSDGTGSMMQEFRVGRNNQSTEFSGSLRSTTAGPAGVDLVKQGTGTLTLSGANTYDGATRVEAGTLLINGTQTGGDIVTVEDGAALGGTGVISTNVVFENGAGFEFNPNGALTVNGTMVDLGNLSVAGLAGLNHETVTAGRTYTLIDGSATFIFDDVQNMSLETAVDIGGGKRAYFKNDQWLKLVIVPEIAPMAVHLDRSGGPLSVTLGDLSDLPEVTNVVQMREDLTTGAWSNLYGITGVTETNLVLSSDRPQCFFRFQTGYASWDSADYRVLVAGDSTVYNFDPIVGWGQRLGLRLKSEYTVINEAWPGSSSKTFLLDGRWDNLMGQVRSGNYILVQFAHNDSHNSTEPESTDAETDYKDYLRIYADDAAAAGANLIFVTPPHRRLFNGDGTITQELLPYANAMKDVAQEKGVPVVDLYSLSGADMQALGDEGCLPLFCSATDRTHFSEEGANWLSGLVAGELEKITDLVQED